MHRDPKTGIPIHPALNPEKAKSWVPPSDWKPIETNWLPSDKDQQLMPVVVSKTKRNDDQLFSTLGGYALYCSDENESNQSKRYIYKVRNVKIKCGIDTSSKWFIVKIYTGMEGKCESINKQAFFLQFLGRLHAFYIIPDQKRGNKLYLIQDLIEGDTFQAFMKNFRPQTFHEKLREAKAILNALIDLNSKGIVHGDIHHANVIRQANGKYEFIDFEYSTLRNPDKINELFKLDEWVFRHLFSNEEMKMLEVMRQKDIQTTPLERRNTYMRVLDTLIAEEQLKHQQSVSRHWFISYPYDMKPEVAKKEKSARKKCEII